MPTPPPESRSPGPPAPDERRLGVSGTQVATSALASVSAAVVASLFGVAGTIAGAAVVSVVATVGTAVYGRSIRRTAARLQQVPRRVAPRGDGPAAVATGETGGARDAGDGRPPGATADAAPGAGGEPVELDVPPAGPGWWVRLGRRRWGLAAGVAVVLVLSLGAVSVIELAGGRPLSGEASGGRTSIGVLLPGGGGDGDGDGDGDGEVPDDDGTGTTTAPTAPATTAPGEGDGTGDTVPPPGGIATTTSSTVATTTTTAPPTQPTAEPQATPEG
ncbi:MAG TPA: hypothetical protein VFZ79_02125 [Acidimicrobiales bacterium]